MTKTKPAAILIHEHSARVKGSDGTVYCVRIFGCERAHDTWMGWLEFVPLEASGAVLRTGQETSQPDYSALEYWAGGLEPVYLEGALERAQHRAQNEVIAGPKPPA